jgi:hypothetical protein
VLKLAIDPAEQGKSSLVTVYLEGELDESTGKAVVPLSGLNADKIVFNFRDVKTCNSRGIFDWMQFLDQFENGRQIYYDECTPDIMRQINLIPAFSGSAEVRSFYIRFECDDCGAESSALLDVSVGERAMLTRIQDLYCPRCQSEALTLEDEPSSLFLFLDDD